MGKEVNRRRKADTKRKQENKEKRDRKHRKAEDRGTIKTPENKVKNFPEKD